MQSDFHRDARPGHIMKIDQRQLRAASKAAGLERKAGCFDNLHGVLGFLWQLKEGEGGGVRRAHLHICPVALTATK